MKKNLLIIMLGIFYTGIQAQTASWTVVYNIFQAKCASCHSGSSPSASLDLSAASGTVYTSIINKTPVNPAAASRGDKVVFPGDGHRSFLLRKCQNGLDSDNGIIPAEGNVMPDDGTTLSKIEIETIRQWILYGAKQTGVAVDTALIGKYYRGKKRDYTTVLAAPAAGKGFQIHYGPIMLAPKTEVENFLKFDPHFSDSMEVIRLDLRINKKTSHHFIIYKFAPGDETNFANGLRPLNNKPGLSSMENAWQTPGDAVLPAGTAYRWAKNAFLDLNLHCFNTDPDSVVMTDARVNIYTQPYGTASAVMYSELPGNNGFAVPNGNVDVKIIKEQTWPKLTNMYIWRLSSHTHKYGVDYDIYKRKSTGGKDTTQLFEGFYNFTYSFNQGFYDWEDPAVRTFNPLYSINPKDGLYAEAHYKNNGPAPVTVGYTTSDEMMLFFINYTVKMPTTSGLNNVPYENS
ncbi:MAG: hypothetical protein H0W84_13445, partial [Bacteroidetes bacterium]|nr:hypothetical protein [Bacteroidota bacterium]